ncbi:Solute carrier family 13 member 2 [Fasciolopsis buskii]|uniref:Solute carrier family 13 member 2 n=1 Tax=Fasciolopsis buskii TaxID=27845 RepID=A0A8E0RMC1_9TREM|nr:Solute carrier family 13 member 2 [Fasciolopsis buski]
MHLSTDFRKLWTIFVAFRRLAFIVLFPALLAILPATIPGQAAKGAFVLLLMSGFWLTEVVPIYVTALFPVVFGPMMGLMKSSKVCQAYMKDTNMLFIGGLFVATAIEHRGLHKRIALSVLRIVGSDPKIKSQMLQMLHEAQQSTPDFATDGKHTELRDALTTGVVEVQATDRDADDKDELVRLRVMKRLSVALSLSICYSSTCGGIATITGTAPNSILFGLVNSSFCRSTRGSKRDEMVKEVIAKETRVLGRFTYAEAICTILFLLITLLWVTRNAGSAGWGRFFNKQGEVFVTDTQPAMVVSLLALILPAVGPLELWRYQYHHYKDTSAAVDFSNQFLLPWHVAQKRIPWGVVFVLGGGFALSDICQSSGLSAEVGQFLGERFSRLPVMGLVLVCSVCAALLTELTSNAATASILLPIMFSLSESLKIHPFMLAFPVTVGTSFAFSLPAATPPNSIVFGKGRVKVMHMIRTGVFLNVIGSVVSLFAMFTYTPSLFGLRQFPDWAVNVTAGSAPQH